MNGRGNGGGGGNGETGRDTSSGGKFEDKVIRKAIRILRKNNYQFNQTGHKDKRDLMHGNKYKAVVCREHGFIRYLKDKNINCTELLGKKYLPDVAVIREDQKMLYIIEIKTQTQSGSVDEKLQTCDFKKRLYRVLARELKFRDVEYIYVLDKNWFSESDKKYKEVFKYIKWVGCDYYFDEIPLAQMGLYDTQPDS